MNICVDCIHPRPPHGQLAIAICCYCGKCDVCVWRPLAEDHLKKKIHKIDFDIQEQLDELVA